MLLQLSQLSPLYPSQAGTPIPSSIPPTAYPSSRPWIMHMFFGPSISYTVLNIPQPILCLPIYASYLIPAPFHHSPSPPFYLITLQVIFTSMILFLFWLFA